MTDEKDPIFVRYVELTPKGEELFDRLLTFLEDNADLAAKGINLVVEKMVEDGKLPQSSTPTARETE